MSLSDRQTRLIERFRAGEEHALARAISLVENQSPGFESLLDALRGGVGRARRIGITGPPGAGKSTLTKGLTRILRDGGSRVGVIAVDPTSPFTGGAILGDRIRMTELALEPGVFIRSMASRGSLGGLATAAREAADLMDAFGFDRIVIETLGVGQSELEIADSADSTVVVLVPESGDGIQAMKAGLMEVADLFCVNKADRPGAKRLVKEIEVMKAIRAGNAWQGVPRHHARLSGSPAARGADLEPDADAGAEEADPEAAATEPEIVVLETVATDGTGVAELADAIDAHFVAIRDSGELERRRAHALIDQTRQILLRRAEAQVLKAWEARLPEFRQALVAGQISPYAVAAELAAALGV